MNLPRHARLVTVAAGFALLALAALGAASGARAQAIGFLLDNKPSTAGTIFPEPAFAFNSASANPKSIAVTRKSAGVYDVAFVGLGNGNPSNVQVSAVTATSNHCQTSGWVSAAKFKNVGVVVLCFDKNGAHADTGFSLLYQSRANFPPGNATLGFVLANQPAAAGYTPIATGSFNSTGGANSVARIGTGSYSVTMPGVALTTFGVPLVTAVNGAAVRCSVGTWSPVQVLCFEQSGDPIDSEFAVLYGDMTSLAAGPSTLHGFYGWACQQGTTALYAIGGPCSPYTFNSLTFGGLFARKIATGKYLVIAGGPATYQKSTALVAAYGSVARNCNVASWSVVKNEILVNCFGAGGVPTDMEFQIEYATAGSP
jgi:hypothetical protein